MKTISKAQRQLDGDLLLKTDTQALLRRTVQDLHQRLSALPADGRSAADEDSLRALAALQKALGDHAGILPTVSELLGDPRKELVARNLLKV